jgi:hypothetical protein
LWGLGYWGPYRASAGNVVHLFLVLAAVVLVARLIQGKGAL